MHSQKVFIRCGFHPLCLPKTALSDEQPHLTSGDAAVQKGMDLDSKVDKYSLLKPAVTANIKLCRRLYDPGPLYLWNMTGVNNLDLTDYNTA